MAVPFPAAEESSAGSHAPRLWEGLAGRSSRRCHGRHGTEVLGQRVPVGGGTDSLTCPAVARPRVLGSRQPRAVHILPLPLPGPGGRECDSSRFLCTKKKDDPGEKQDPTSCPAVALPYRASAPSLNICLQDTTYLRCGSAALNHSSLGQPAPPAFPLQELLPRFYSCQALSCLPASDSFPGPIRRAHIPLTHLPSQQRLQTATALTQALLTNAIDPLVRGRRNLEATAALRRSHLLSQGLLLLPRALNIGPQTLSEEASASSTLALSLSPSHMHLFPAAQENGDVLGTPE